MRSTGSSRTGMQWRLSELSAGTREASRGWWVTSLERASSTFLLLALVAACARPTYTAPYQSPRLNTGGIRDVSEEQLRAECDRLIATRTPPTGEATLLIQVAADGKVSEAKITRSSGDRRVDEIFGQAAARLQFDPMPGETSARIKMGWSCSPGNAVTTLTVVSG